MKRKEHNKCGPAALLEILDGTRRWSPLGALASFLTWLENTYAVGLDIYLAAEKIGLRRRFRVPVHVVSIGNLSVGGTGKTPATITIARELTALGFRIAILSRGHGGSASQHGAVVSDPDGAIFLSTQESGDEPMLLALALPGVPVFVGKDRRKTAALAVEKFAPDILLLDDGFQYWQLYRDVDIVLLDADRPFENGHCLPRGALREPKRNLRRAQIIVVTRSSHLREEQKAELLKNVRVFAPDASVFYSDHVAGVCTAANEAAQKTGNPTSPLAICAIARPESFLETLSAAGIHPSSNMILPDHYHYKPSDRSKIVGKMKKSHASTIVTTQKDYVKLKGVVPEIPIFVQQIDLTFDEPSAVFCSILTKLDLPETLLGRVETC